MYESMYGILATILHKYLLETYFCFACKLLKKTFLFPKEQVTIQSPQENSPLTALKPKVHIFHYFFVKKSYLLTAIQSKLVVGINYI